MKFDVSLYDLSCVFWRCVPQPSMEYEKESRSVTLQNCSYLVGLCLKLGVETVIEIGAGISTQFMAQAVDRIWTCDRSAINLGPMASNVVFQRSESTEFLKSLEEPADLFFLDARLHKEDVAHIKRLSKPHTVYVLDDFEGLEKGVSNGFMLVEEGWMLMQPVDGRHGRSTLAALIPKNLIRLVNQ